VQAAGGLPFPCRTLYSIFSPVSRTFFGSLALMEWVRRIFTWKNQQPIVFKG